jgi:uncharacterized protein (DUF1684 family)
VKTRERIHLNRGWFLLLPLAIMIFGCSTQHDPKYEHEIENFRDKRVAFLKSEKGYLNLVGLFWLKEGENSFGSGVDNDLQFPAEFPKTFGSVFRSGKKVTFNYIEPVDLKGDAVSSATIDIDDRSKVFSRGSFQWFILESGGNYAIRMRNFNNPLINKPLNLKFYKVAADWRISGHYTAYDNVQSRTITNIRDIQYEQKAPGMITFERNGMSYSFEPRRNSEGLSVIFTDHTTGNETFSGGRFLLLDEPDNNGNIILDFNKALNFPCAYNAYTTCPVPPESNRLALAVLAGEKASSP